MGDAPSPEEKLHLITRNLQVGPWGWDAPLGTEDLKSRDARYRSLNVLGPRSPHLGGSKALSAS